jgi:hypothetical protein
MTSKLNVGHRGNLITGGTRAGANLLHNFYHFSVGVNNGVNNNVGHKLESYIWPN